MGKNLNKINLHFYEDSPKSLPNRFRIIEQKPKIRYEGNKKWDGTFTKGKYFYRYLERFLKKNVGRNINKVYSEFCEKFPGERFCDINPKEAFKKYITKDYHYFYVDIQNRLQFDKERYAKTHHSSPVHFHTEEFERRFKINFNFLDKHPELYDDLKRLGGAKSFEKLLTGDIDEKTYWKFTTYNWEFFEKKSQELWPNKTRFMSDRQWRIVNGVNLMHEIFKEYRKYDFEEMVDKKSTFYKKYKAEENTQINKRNKERKKRNKEKYDTLLHDIENRRKEKEREKDIIDRDRLGFDDESFKGEFYHGQKRKKKKERE